MILDSNLATNSWAVSAASKVEVLGYHKLTDKDRVFFESVFATAKIHPVTDAVVDQAVALRQMRKLSLGDALIAATALVLNEELHTHNLKDFAGIPGLRVFDPIAAGDSS